MYFKGTMLRSDRCTNVNLLVWNKVTKFSSIFHLWYKFQLMPFAKANCQVKMRSNAIVYCRELFRWCSQHAHIWVNKGQAEGERTLQHFVTLCLSLISIRTVDSIVMKGYQNLPELSHLQRTSFVLFSLVNDRLWNIVHDFADSACSIEVPW